MIMGNFGNQIAPKGNQEVPRVHQVPPKEQPGAPRDDMELLEHSIVRF